MERPVNWRRLSAGLMLAAVLTAGAGCAQDVGDIDRTQPDKIKKADFINDDQWYFRQAVVSTDMQGSVIFAALEGGLKRIRWEVTETVLYAYSVTELSKGLNDGFDESETRRLGAVAAFPITGHFDIQRTYNASTGEQNNVIVENTTDRPWYERDYMRVDWSNNLVDGYNMLQNYLGSASPAKYRLPQDLGKIDPDRTRFSEDYIDAVTEYNYEPDIMACYGAYGLDAIFNCEGGRLRVRNSFLKVNDRDKRYEPLQYTDMELIRDTNGEPLETSLVYDSSIGFQMEVVCNQQTDDFFRRQYGSDRERNCSRSYFDLFSRFGYFRTEWTKWDRFYGTPEDTNRLYFANRWNIWQTMKDEEGRVLDMKDRTPQPITYYLNVEYPEFMFDAAQAVAQEWDKAFREAVMVAKGISAAELDAELEDLYGHTNMFRIVENSCHPGPLAAWKAELGRTQDADRTPPSQIFTSFVGDNLEGEALERALWGLSNQRRTQLCAELEFATELRPKAEHRFDWERFGDLRYSFFNWVETDVPWAGYGPSAADPMTGEIINGNANFAGGYIRRSAAYAADLIQYFNGELHEDDIRYGKQVYRDLATRQQGLSTEAKRDIMRRAGLVPSDVSPTNFAARPEVKDLPEFVLQHGRERIEAEVDRMMQINAQTRNLDTRRIEFLEKPEVKQFLLRDTEMALAVKAIAHERFGADPDEHALHQSYLELFEPRLANMRYEARSRFLSDRNIMTYDGLLRSVESLVTYQGAVDYFAGKPRAEIIDYFMQNMFIGTQLHEIGHTVGLRHNFAASTDALNYHDEYWLIEKAIADGLITRDEVHSIDADLARTITGKDVDYLNQAELRLASVMDYTGDLTGRFAGLGKYDHAAIKFAYAEVVEQWKEDIPLPNLLSYETWLADYRELPRIFANQGGSGVATNPEVQKRGIDVILNGREYVPIKTAIAQRRDGILNNTSDWQNQGLSPSNRPFIDRSVTYSFCSDDYRGSSLNCDIYDYGSNQMEIVTHWFDTYRALQPFWRYKRHGISRNYENYSSYINRVMSTFEALNTPFRYYSIYQWWDLGSYTDDLRDAAMAGVNFYGEIMAIPQPGRYCLYSQNVDINIHWYYDLNNVYVPSSWDRRRGTCGTASVPALDIEKGYGQYYGFNFTDEYEYRIERVGTYVDKSIASQMMFDIAADFAYSSFFTDFRATNISYWTLFKDEILGMMRGILLNDYNSFGGVYNNGRYEPPVMVDFERFNRGTPHPQDGLPRVQTSLSINHQFNMLVGGMISASGWEDRNVDFAQYVKVAVGNEELQPYGPDVVLHEFVHPLTGQIYVAPQTADGKSITVELVEWANRLKVRYLDAKATLDAAEPGTAAWETANRNFRGRSEQMEDVVAKLDMIRYVWAALGANALR